MRRNNLRVQFLLVLVVLSLSQFVSAQNTIHVPGDQATIQEAINVANPGDTVLVAPGTYSENLNFSGKAITVTSSGGAAQTIIDGSAKAPVVIFNTGEGLKSVLNGFTIQNGSTLNTPFEGAGISINSASPTIINNVIQNNSGCTGGGMAVQFSSALIQGNTITNNNDFACSGGDGAGIYVGGSGSAQIIGNVITNNSATNGGAGGGIALFAAGTPTLRNNIIYGNAAGGVSPATQGGGIWIVNQSDALIVQNLIYNNSAQQGSGIYFLVPSGDVGPTLVNNSIVGASGGTQGSAVYAAGFDSQVRFFNNLLIGAAGINAVYCDGLYQPQPPTFTNNDAFSSGATGFAGTCVSSGGQNGNISADPLFVNPASDFHLQSGSPAIDAGTNSAPNLQQTDISGNLRIADGNNDCVSTVDLGVYELQRTANVSFSTNSLSFGNQLIGTSSGGHPVTLTNTGGACFQFSSVQITGDFSQGNNCPSAGVLGGTSCTYTVVFTPTTAGARSGALIVNGTDGITSSNLNVNLTGTGVGPQPAISLSPSSLSFGNQVVGTSSVPQAVTVTSTGNVALMISGISVSAAFSQTNNCPASLAPNATCTISVTFGPASAGVQAGTLNVSDNASGSPQTATLTGIGVDFSIGVNPTSATIKHGQSANFNVSVSPVGGAFNSAVSLSCSGLPISVACGFSPTSVTPGSQGATSIMTISTNGKTVRGSFNVVITGTSGSDSHSATLALTVN